MKWFVLILFCWIGIDVCAQEQQFSRILEDQAIATEGSEQEEDVLQLYNFKRKKLNINCATAEELALFPFWNPLLTEQLVRYRMLLGNLENVLELQAVPGFTEEIVRKLLPFITVSQQESAKTSILKSLKESDKMMLVRTSVPIGIADSTVFNPYFLLRYQLKSDHVLMGILTEKDSGEKFYQGKKGISFFSKYVVLQNLGKIRKLIIGDYMVNIGQGLVIWQGRPIRKTSLPLLVKRESAQLQPYKSTDENRFMRGIAAEFKIRRLNLIGFLSSNTFDATICEDTIMKSQYISSFSNTGLHVKENELIGKNSVLVRSGGVAIDYSFSNLKFGYTFVKHNLNVSMIHESLPYNLYALSGKHWVSEGIHYSATLRNLHFFGETAKDGLKHWATINGILVSPDPKLDVSLVYRNIDKSYRSFYSNSFTEATEPNNEEGLYMGTVLKLNPRLDFNSYIDIYRFPWLKYGLNKGGWGYDYMTMLLWKPVKTTEIYFRVKKEQKTANGTSVLPMLPVDLIHTTSFRLHLEKQFSLQTSWRMRMEYVSCKMGDQFNFGMLAYTDVFWKIPKSSFQINGRMMVFETTDYKSRIYAFENDLAFSNSIPSFYGRGVKMYMNMRYGIAKRCNFYLKYSWMKQQKWTTLGLRGEVVIYW
jgi:hypothetical protein